MGIPFAEVIGDPIAHSKSPLIHKFWLEKLGLEGDYRATRVSLEHLSAWLEQRREDPDWRGCNVAMPLKVEAMKWIDEADPPVRQIGALNCIAPHEGRLVGGNKDSEAVRILLDKAGAKPEKVAIIGTGGAARAALEQVRQAKVSDIQLVTRNPEKARRLFDEFGLEGSAVERVMPEYVDLLINASPLGMLGYDLPAVDLSRLRAGAIVFDMVYAPAETRLLRSARELQIRTIDGLAMLIQQAALAFLLFFGRTPDETVQDELRERLTS